jgi:hypothetical protein
MINGEYIGNYARIRFENHPQENKQVKEMRLFSWGLLLPNFEKANLKVLAVYLPWNQSS